MLMDGIGAMRIERFATDTIEKILRALSASR